MQNFMQNVFEGPWGFFYDAAMHDTQRGAAVHYALATMLGLNAQNREDLDVARELWRLVMGMDEEGRNALHTAFIAAAWGSGPDALEAIIAELPEPQAAFLVRLQPRVEASKRPPTVGFFWPRKKRSDEPPPGSRLPDRPVYDVRGNEIVIGDDLKDLTINRRLRVIDIVQERGYSPVVITRTPEGSTLPEIAAPAGNRYELIDDLVIRLPRSHTRKLELEAMAVGGRRRGANRRRRLPTRQRSTRRG